MAGPVDTDDQAVAGLDRGDDRMVLDRRAHRDAAPTVDRTEHRGVVRLRAATREDHLARPAADRRGDDVARLVDAAPRSRAKRCDPDGLAKRSDRNGSIASTASGRIGVVAAWSR